MAVWNKRNADDIAKQTEDNIDKSLHTLRQEGEKNKQEKDFSKLPIKTKSVSCRLTPEEIKNIFTLLKSKDFNIERLSIAKILKFSFYRFCEDIKAGKIKPSDLVKYE